MLESINKPILEKQIKIKKAICHWSDGNYRNKLTEGKEYILLEEIEGIFPNNPYVLFIGDDGEKAYCYKGRFTFK